jgi:hypothetical protein
MADEVRREATAPGGRSPEDSTDREAEHGDVAEPDAPTAGEENEGLSTVLSAEPVVGVQSDASDE